MNIDIKTKIGTTTEALAPLAPKVNQIIANVPELRNYTLSVNGNTIAISVRLVKKDQRENNSFEVQDKILEQLSYLRSL